MARGLGAVIPRGSSVSVGLCVIRRVGGHLGSGMNPMRAHTELAVHRTAEHPDRGHALQRQGHGEQANHDQSKESRHPHSLAPDTKPRRLAHLSVDRLEIRA